MADQNNKKDIENVKLDKQEVLDIKKELPKRKNYRVLVLSSFINQLKEDKLYLICFIITIIFFGIFSFDKVRDGSGIFSSNDAIESTKKENNLLEEKLDMTKYVGIYVKNYRLNKTIKINDKCEFKTYDYIYQVNKNNKINKYMYNECLGTVLIYSDTLGYVKSENSKNIGSKSFIYVFKDNKLTELDGLTYTKNISYKIDDDILDLKDTKLIFHGDKFILDNVKELYLINGKEIETEIVTDSLLSKSVFRIKDSSNFKYIDYMEGETQTCYVKSTTQEVGFEDKNTYTIYSVKFNEDTLSFSDPFIEVVRKRSDTCDTLNDDLSSLGS